MELRGILHPRLLQRLEVRVDLALAFLQPRQFRAGQRQLEGELAVAHLQVAPRPATLSRQTADLRLHFRDQVVHACQVRIGFIESPRRHPTPVLITPDARRLLEHGAALLGLIAEDRVDHAAFDDRVGVGPEPRVPAEILDIAQPTQRAVQAILALATREDRAADLHIGVRDGQQVILVRQPQSDLGPLNRLPAHRALKDRLLHPRAADRRGPLLTQHPTQPVGDVGLPAAVRPHDRRDAIVEADLG